MSIVYAVHARRRMRQRGVREVDVQVALSHPDEIRHTPRNSMLYLRTMTDGRTLKVWIVHPPRVHGETFVKSVAWKGEPDDQ